MRIVFFANEYLIQSNHAAAKHLVGSEGLLPLRMRNSILQKYNERYFEFCGYKKSPSSEAPAIVKINPTTFTTLI